MKWSFPVARISGIDVRVHVTFFLLLAWFAVAYYASGGYGAMIEGLAFIMLLFVCVLLHEFGHALAARAYGIRTPDITLLPIGGVARLERFPDKPWQELVVALGGPAVNVVIALGIFLVLGQFIDWRDLAGIVEGRGQLLVKLLAINVMLVLFNLLPAFPMDGGRVLRALLATRMKHARATHVAAIVGQIMAVGFGLLGIFGGNPFLILIGVFVFFGAQTEATYARFKEATEDTPVTRIMRPMPPVLQPQMNVSQAARAAMTGTGYLALLPVTDASLRLIAVIPVASLAEALTLHPEGPIAPLARHDFEVLTSDASLSEAWVTIRTSAQDVFPVVNPGGQLVGIVTRDDIETALGELR